MKLSRVILLSLFVPFTSLSAADYDVYVLTGQSNSLGTTGGGEIDWTPGEHPGDVDTAFFWSNVSPTSRDPDRVTLYGDSGGRTISLRMQQGDGGQNARFWGPEFGFARTMFDAGRRNVLIVKAPRGGGGNSFWIRGSGHMYAHVVDAVRDATDELVDDGHTFAVRGLLYLQGESDSSAEASVTGDRLRDLLRNLREDLPNAAQMHAVVGGIAADGSAKDVVRQGQRALATENADFEYFSNLDLRGQLYDSLHFDKVAKLTVGERFARTFLAHDGEIAVVENASFSTVVSDAESAAVVFEDYVPDTNGAANGVVLEAAGVFRGFVDGRAGGVPVGLVVEGAAGSVVFADYRSSVATSDIAVGPFGNPAYPDSGREVTIRFVDPLDLSRPASVSGVAFRFGATNQADKVTVSFRDLQDRELHSTATVPVEPFGARAFVLKPPSDGGESPNGLIHSIRFRTNGPQGELWVLGSFDDQSEESVDIAFRGFAIRAPAGSVRPGDANLDGAVDVSDAIFSITMLFLDAALSLPCDGASPQDPGNRALLDVNGSGVVDLSDPVFLLQYLFHAGGPPVLGVDCIAIEDCQSACN